VKTSLIPLLDKVASISDLQIPNHQLQYEQEYDDNNITDDKLKFPENNSPEVEAIHSSTVMSDNIYECVSLLRHITLQLELSIQRHTVLSNRLKYEEHLARESIVSNLNAKKIQNDNYKL
jgi:hypothetical protein